MVGLGAGASARLRRRPRSPRSSCAYDVAPRSAATLPVPADVATAGDPAAEVLLAEVDGRRGWWWFAEDRDAALPAQDLSARARAVDDGYEVDGHRPVAGQGPGGPRRPGGPGRRVDAMLLTLLPGESATIAVRSAGGVAPEAFLEPLVLRSANQLVYR